MSEGTKPGADNKATPEELAAARNEAVKAERARVSGIQTCEEAKGRETLANHLALNTDMSVDAAKAILAAAPKQAAAPSGNAFREAMNSGSNPNVGADATGAEPGDKPNRVARLLQTAQQVGVRGFDKKSEASKH